jgi:prepilin-type N-terminal cleavage/methylation domain-containing protein
MDTMSKAREPRRGFTLIELLAVIVIIGILAGLITMAAVAAINKAKKARIKSEIALLETAIQNYINEFDDLPDFTDTAAVQRHMKNRWPDITDAQINSVLSNQNTASSIVFFLGGMSDPANPKKLIGFSADKRNPFNTSLDVSRDPPRFQFDQARLGRMNGVLVYYPELGVTMNSCPFVYFRSRGKAGYDATQTCDISGRDGASGDTQKIQPYYNTETGDWANAGSFQLISAGLDDRFGVGNKYPVGSDYSPETFDNITNFSNITLDDMRP